jgi:NCS1 family nucleobase:cation symporter-1
MPALICYALGIVVQIPFIATDLYTGPIARAIGGVDLSWIIGLLFVSPVYYFAARDRPATVIATQRSDTSVERPIG